MMNIVELESIVIVFFFIPLLLTVRNYLYKKQGLIVWSGEDLLFCYSMFLVLTVIGVKTSNQFIAAMGLPFIIYTTIPYLNIIIKKIRGK